MIKNIVFDMGKVLTDYVADEVCRRFIEDEAERRQVCTSVFISPAGYGRDRGGGGS